MNQRMNQIFIYIRENPMSTEGQIASGVGLKRTPYTRKILLALVEEGIVRRYWADFEGRGRYVYHIQETDQMPL